MSCLVFHVSVSLSRPLSAGLMDKADVVHGLLDEVKLSLSHFIGWLGVWQLAFTFTIRLGLAPRNPPPRTNFAPSYQRERSVVTTLLFLQHQPTFDLHRLQSIRFWTGALILLLFFSL